jgi:hypothetical protein
LPISFCKHHHRLRRHLLMKQNATDSNPTTTTPVRCIPTLKDSTLRGRSWGRSGISRTLSTTITTNEPIYSTLPVDIPTDYPPIYSTLPVNISTDYPLYSLRRYSNRLSTLPTICSPLSGVTPTDYATCSTLLYSTLLCLTILQPTLRSALPVDIPTDYPPIYSTLPVD